MTVDISHAGVEPIGYEYDLEQTGRWTWSVGLRLRYRNALPDISRRSATFLGEARSRRKAEAMGRRLLRNERRRWASHTEHTR